MSTKYADTNTVQRLVQKLKDTFIKGIAYSNGTITVTHGNDATSTLDLSDMVYENATALRDGLLSKEDKAKIDNVFFSESTFTTQPGGQVEAGYLSSSGTTIVFNLRLPKFATDVDTMTLTSLKVNVWHPGNGYLLASEFTTGGVQVINNSDFSIYTDLETNKRYLYVSISKTSSNFRDDPEMSSGSVQFNTPVTVRVHQYSLDMTY